MDIYGNLCLTVLYKWKVKVREVSTLYQPLPPAAGGVGDRNFCGRGRKKMGLLVLHWSNILQPLPPYSKYASTPSLQLSLLHSLFILYLTQVFCKHPPFPRQQTTSL